MKVSIYSRNQINQLIEKGIPNNFAIISFADSPHDFVEFPPTTTVLKVCFADARPFTTSKSKYDSILPEAKQIATFVKSSISEGKDIICQCDYGISRSSGCAAAILEYYSQKGIDVFSDYRYSPNQFVYKRVLEELVKAQ